MKKALVLVALLAFVGAASASVQIFFTSSAQGYGVLTVPEGPFDPTAATVYDDTVGTGDDQTAGYTGHWSPTPAAATVNIAAGEYALVWVRFNSELNGKKIQGLDLVLGGTAHVADLGYYVLDNGLTVADKRWDGKYTPPTEPEFKGNPEQVLVGVTAFGIQNSATTNDMWLYSGGTARTALLGAIKFDSVGSGSYTLGPKGIIYKGGTSPTVDFFGLTVTPEPASFLLLGLAGLFLRRR